MEVLKYRKDANSPWQDIIAIKGDAGLTEAEIIEIIDNHLEELGIDNTGSGGGSVSGVDSTGLEYVANSSLTEYTLIGRGTNTDAEIVIPSYVDNIPVVAIGEGAFKDDLTLKKITFPNTLTTIGVEAFSGCLNLGNFIIPNSITTIGNYAFYNCETITEVAIPSSVVNVGSAIFFNCFCLNTAVIGCKTISTFMFANCPLTTSTVIEDTVEAINGGAFYASEMVSIFIPSTVKTVADNSSPTYAGAFEFADELTEVRVGWAEGAVSGAPWRAENATIIYNAVA